jgi:hypothetical protein
MRTAALVCGAWLTCCARDGHHPSETVLFLLFFSAGCGAAAPASRSRRFFSSLRLRFYLWAKV